MNKLIRIFLVGFCLITGLSGCSNAKLDGEGQSFVSNMLQGQVKHWDCTKLDGLLTPNGTIKLADLKTIFAMYQECLGPLESFGELKQTQTRVMISSDSDYQAIYTADLKCAKGKGVGTFQVSHNKSGFTFTTLTVVSDNFQKYRLKERKEAAKFADEFTKQVAASWSYDVLTENADPALSQLLDKDSTAAKAFMMAGAATLGGLKEFTPAHFTNFNPIQGRMVYCFATNEAFEKSNATVRVDVVQNEEHAWKVYSFHFDAHK